MNKDTDLRSWSTRQAVAILSVDNIKTSSAGLDVLKRYDEGKISYDQAKDEILRKVKRNAVWDGG